jgi:hypothetical protein
LVPSQEKPPEHPKDLQQLLTDSQKKEKDLKERT